MKIDIIIPCYKAHKTLPRLLGSILSQTIIKDLRVTLVNDNDEKDYQEIINLFKNFMDIQEIKLDKNSGPGTARRIGYEKTNNPLVIWADADDIFANAFALQRLREELLLDESNAICIGDFVEEVKVQILINLYRKYAETKELFPEYKKQNWQHCKRYYNEVYKSIKEKVPQELISSI